MKFILALILILTFADAFAGGQTGSGMNGCWTKNHYGITEWRSIEEIMYPEMIVKRPQGSSRRYSTNPQWLYVPNSRYFDMTQKYYARRALERISNLELSHPKSFHVFKELFKLFEHVQVSNLKLSGIYKGELSNRHRICKDFSPAMLTFKNGSIVVFKDIFERLDPLSAEILYIHETIRFAQTYHPVFHDLSDSNLQRLTSQFFMNRLKYDTVDEILGKYEERLAFGKYKTDLTLKEVITAEDYDTEIVFRAKFVEAVLVNEENLGTEINRLRINDLMFKEISYKQTLQVLQSANRQK